MLHRWESDSLPPKFIEPIVTEIADQPKGVDPMLIEFTFFRQPVPRRRFRRDGKKSKRAAAVGTGGSWQAGVCKCIPEIEVISRGPTDAVAGSINAVFQKVFGNGGGVIIRRVVAVIAVGDGPTWVVWPLVRGVEFVAAFF